MPAPSLRTACFALAAAMTAGTAAHADDGPRIRVDLELGASGLASSPQREQFGPGVVGGLRARVRLLGPVGLHAMISGHGFSPEDPAQGWGSLLTGGLGIHAAQRFGPLTVIVDGDALLFPAPPSAQGEDRTGLAFGVGAAFLLRAGPSLDLGPFARGTFGQIVFASAADDRDDVAAWSAGVALSFHPSDAPRVVRDSDGDGLVDSVDRCPAASEDLDGYEDGDGCPDPDNDGDGTFDLHDRCPSAREDRDGFDDSDGCPDPDNDGDGVDDARDACPAEPEDPDGVGDDDGCPDEDDDRDGVRDDDDRCRTQPETRNGFLDGDGCPDEEPPRATIQTGRVVLNRPVAFEDRSDRFRMTSLPVLDALAALLREHPEVSAIRVDASADELPTPAANRDLSLRRARAVLRHLGARGVNPLRVAPAGVGSTRLPDNGRVSVTIIAGPWARVGPAP